jgi:microsomal dipeptidase-like Zn-dependent dipeptidase
MSILSGNIVVDMHNHPALKSYLFGSDLSVRNPARPHLSIFDMQDVYTDLPKLASGRVDVAMSAYYLPERGLYDNSPTIRDVANSPLRFIITRYWLTGKEISDMLGLDLEQDPCLGEIVDTMKKIKALTGNCNHIAFGTDYDGFTDTPNDLKDISFMPLVRERLLKDFSSEEVRNIMGGNALRVLEQGWKPAEMIIV